MEKTFTISVPDELWVDSWNTNKTESYNYSGPEKIWVLIERDNTPSDWSDKEISANEERGEIVKEIDAAVDTDIAYYLVHTDEIWDYSYTTKINHDNSEYQEITNPRLHDYFELDHNIGQGLILNPKYKESTTIAEETAIKRLNYVKKYNDTYDFDTETQSTIDKFISETTAYLETMKPVYPWKYVTISHDDIPKVPASLITVFKELPELD